VVPFSALKRKNASKAKNSQNHRLTFETIEVWWLAGFHGTSKNFRTLKTWYPRKNQPKHKSLKTTGCETAKD